MVPARSSWSLVLRHWSPSNEQSATSNQQPATGKMHIDAHQHFWHYSAAEYGWIDESLAALRRDFLPGDLLTAMQDAGVDQCIAVQARQSVEETAWLLQLAGENDFVAGVVGWAPLATDG